MQPLELKYGNSSSNPQSGNLECLAVYSTSDIVFCLLLLHSNTSLVVIIAEGWGWMWDPSQVCTGMANRQSCTIWGKMERTFESFDMDLNVCASTGWMVAGILPPIPSYSPAFCMSAMRSAFERKVAKCRRNPKWYDWLVRKRQNWGQEGVAAACEPWGRPWHHPHFHHCLRPHVRKTPEDHDSQLDQEHQVWSGSNLANLCHPEGLAFVHSTLLCWGGHLLRPTSVLSGTHVSYRVRWWQAWSGNER